MMDLFDYAKATEARDLGMMSAAERRAELLDVARDVARAHAVRNNGTCTAEDVARQFARMGIEWSELGNAAGSIFKTKDWVNTGEFKRNSRVQSHARIIWIWRLK